MAAQWHLPQETRHWDFGMFLGPQKWRLSLPQKHTLSHLLIWTGSVKVGQWKGETHSKVKNSLSWSSPRLEEERRFWYFLEFVNGKPTQKVKKRILFSLMSSPRLEEERQFWHFHHFSCRQMVGDALRLPRLRHNIYVWEFWYVGYIYFCRKVWRIIRLYYSDIFHSESSPSSSPVDVVTRWRTTYICVFFFFEILWLDLDKMTPVWKQRKRYKSQNKENQEGNFPLIRGFFFLEIFF